MSPCTGSALLCACCSLFCAVASASLPAGSDAGKEEGGAETECTAIDGTTVGRLCGSPAAARSESAEALATAAAGIAAECDTSLTLALLLALAAAVSAQLPCVA